MAGKTQQGSPRRIDEHRANRRRLVLIPCALIAFAFAVTAYLFADDETGRVAVALVVIGITLAGSLWIASNPRSLQRTLRLSQEKYSKAFEQNGDAIYLFELATGQYLEVNKGFEQLSGFLRHEVIGKTAKDLGIWVDLHDRQRFFDEFNAQGQLRAFQSRFKAKDGREFWGESSADPIEIGGKACILSSTRDVSERRQSEETNAIFAASFEGGSVAQALTSLEGHFLRVNNALARMLGYEPDELVGKPFNDVTHPDDWNIGIQALNELLNAGGASRFEKRYIAKNGTTVWVDASIALVRDSNAQPRHFVAAFVDVTERRRAEDHLRESEERFRQLSEVFPETIFETDLTGRVVYANGHGLRTYGVTSADLAAGINCLDLVSPDDRPIALQRMRERREGAKPNGYLEYRALRKNGEPFCALAYTVPILRQGQIVGLRGFVLDVTERKQSQDKLRDQGIRLRAITESTQDAILTMDSEGRISFWNPAAERMFGYSSDEVIGAVLHQVIAPAQFRAAHGAAFPSFLKTGRGNAVGRNVELRACRRNGQEFPIELSLSAMRQDDSWHAVGVIRDITERKQVEANLLETNLRLEQATARANDMAIEAELASAAKSEFLANMSHEIRTPMNGVIGMTGLLLDTKLDSEQRRYAEAVRASGESLLALINDILDFSKIESGKLELEALDFDLRSIIKEFGEAMALRAKEKGLKFICTVSSKAPSLLRGDSGRLRQILVNLTGNATKFTNSGEIAVAVSLESESAQHVVLRFGVRDTGIGIPRSRQRSLFEKFTQVDASTSRKYGGTGLGLAISKQLAELMGGEIGLRSEQGHGSEFWFTARFEKQPQLCNGDADIQVRDVDSLLVNGPATANPPPGPAPNDSWLADVHVLVAEDNITNQQVALGILRRLGVRAEAVASGSEAIAALRQVPYDLVFMDVQMPEMDGFEATKAIRARHGILKNTVPIIAMTAHAMQGDREKCLQAGMNDYIAKPITPEGIMQVIHRWTTKANAMHPVGDLPVESDLGDTPSFAQIEDIDTTSIFAETALLDRLLGDRDVARVIACSFLEDIPKQIEALQEFLRAHDAKGVERQAHSIKGAAAAIGGEALRTLSAGLEKAGNARDLRAVQASLPELHREFQRLERAMKASALLQTTAEK